VQQPFAWSLGALAAFVAGAHAQTPPTQVAILALGASNTEGWGLPAPDSYPARLEQMLKARGINAVVHNFGIAGDTTRGMSARLQVGMPKGTQLVILQPGINDARVGEGANRARNIEEIRGWLAARGVKLVMMDNEMLDALPRTEVREDGIHFTAAGYTMLAECILPEVLAALGK
jgi:acyl-CoA thioesterase-1